MNSMEGRALCEDVSWNVTMFWWILHSAGKSITATHSILSSIVEDHLFGAEVHPEIIPQYLH
jgi:hypothetical protein